MRGNWKIDVIFCVFYVQLREIIPQYWTDYINNYIEIKVRIAENYCSKGFN
jgi:hypothetical protein